MNFKVRRLGQFIISVLLFFAQHVSAEIEFSGEFNTFFTDDVAVFSASRRLGLREDPTQPFIERTRVGDDVVFEPAAEISKVFHPAWGKMKLETRAQGFLFTSHNRFSHGTYITQVTQALPEAFSLRLRYHYGPNQFLGKNFNRRTRLILKPSEEGEEHEESSENLVSERVTTHFGTVELERSFFDVFMWRILSRYGNRSYNRNFSHRDTNFWTIGTHFEWEVTSRIGLMLGYHYERGRADKRSRATFFEDDLSYKNHYVSAELVAHIAPRLSMILGFDFEKNLFTTNNVVDERHNGNEAIYQGDVEFRYKLLESMYLRAGYQHAQRISTFEEDVAVINTFMIGSIFAF